MLEKANVSAKSRGRAILQWNFINVGMVKIRLVYSKHIFLYLDDLHGLVSKIHSLLLKEKKRKINSN